MDKTMGFWARLDSLLASNEICIDRRKGSHHPRYPDIVYPLDYGYLRSTSGGDENEIDVWRGSLADGLLVAIACTVDTKKSDAEIKLLVGCTEVEINTIDRFHNDNHFMSGIVIRRPEHLAN